ncbi:hypothetical protein [Roseicitreum antarcticum]|nr:hypothetical protein [Roseicitreum antarcticum]
MFVDRTAIHTDTIEAAIGWSEVKVCFADKDETALAVLALVAGDAR